MHEETKKLPTSVYLIGIVGFNVGCRRLSCLRRDSEKNKKHVTNERKNP